MMMARSENPAGERKKEIVPIIHLDRALTESPWKSIPCSKVAVRMYDVLSGSGDRLKSIAYKIKAAGGIHEYLDYSGEVVFSLVMPDELIQKCRPETYAEAIDLLNPDYFTTVDGWTYEGMVEQSAKDIERMKAQTQELIPLCNKSTPIGHVKGASTKQVDEHLKWFLANNISTLLFHTGDFLLKNNKSMVKRAEAYTQQISRDADSLWLYGIGAPRYFEQFSFADCFFTQSHFTAAFRKKQLTPKGWIDSPYLDSAALIDHNLKQMAEIVASLDPSQRQTSLTEYFTEKPCRGAS